MTSRLLIVDDHTLVRKGIIKLLSDRPEFEIVGEASNGFEAISKLRELDVDVVLIDLYMPGLDGVSTTRLIRREFPDVSVVVITASDDEEDVFDAIQAGARGYILKSADPMELTSQLRQVVSGGVGITEGLTSKLVDGLTRRGNNGLNINGAKHEPLTEREKDVLRLISSGATNKFIGVELFISENTVRAHVRSLMQKLHMDNRTQLAVFGVREGYANTGRSNNNLVRTEL